MLKRHIDWRTYCTFEEYKSFEFEFKIYWYFSNENKIVEQISITNYRYLPGII